MVDNVQDGAPGVQIEFRRLIDKGDKEPRATFAILKERIAVTGLCLSDEAMRALCGAWLELRKKKGFMINEENNGTKD